MPRTSRTTATLRAFREADGTMYGYVARTQAGNRLRRRPTARRRSASLSPGILSGVALGSVAVLVGMGWPMQIGQMLMFGAALVLWTVGNFALERPGRTPSRYLGVRDTRHADPRRRC